MFEFIPEESHTNVILKLSIHQDSVAERVLNLEAQLLHRPDAGFVFFGGSSDDLAKAMLFEGLLCNQAPRLSRITAAPELLSA